MGDTHLPSWYQFYANDALAGWFMIAVLQILAGISRYRPHQLIYNGAFQIAVTAGAGLFWEYAAPFYVPGSTSDPLDLAAYLGGAGVYRLVISIHKTYQRN
ncbi:hypothetical protein [Salibacterium lacus]|uniref:Uncharacterized protein n=1 Tax=Salibacterium lacus TaxID=1898109 RepID=A0ABW5T3N1_9BACI